MITLTSIIADILKENITEELLNDSIKFNWKDKTYSWVDDKKGKRIDTSMTTRGEDDKAKYTFTEFLLPRSGIMSYNLYNIKSFYVTQALKHNQVKKSLTPKEIIKHGGKDKKKLYQLTPDPSIEQFKIFTAKYIVKILMSKGYDIDVILSPQSSSTFNADMMNHVADLYQKATNKKVSVIPNTFVKSPKDIKVDTENIRTNIRQELVGMKVKTTSEAIERRVDAKVKDLYKDINIWKLEDDIEPIMQEIYELWTLLLDTKQKRMWDKNRDKVLFQISMVIRNLFKFIEDQFGIDYLETKYFKKGNFEYEAVKTPWQIKHLSDGIRKSIYNIFKLTEQFDFKYSYPSKDNNVISGVSKLIDRLARNNKTIMIFDDNISSGATLDDAASYLINNGVSKENIVVITLGKVPTSVYNLADLKSLSRG